MKEKQKKGIISVFQQIAEQCKERETVEKTCIHVVSPKEVQNMCKDAGLSDAVFYGVLSVSSAIPMECVKMAVMNWKLSLRASY